MKISITIIGHDEEYHLLKLLPELKWADEIVYVDCESRDGSLAVAKKCGCRTFSRPNNSNLNVNKSFAMEKAKGDWIFYLDPDERIPDALREEILSVIKGEPEERAFELRRRNHYFGKWLKRGSRYPDTQLRLFRNGYASFPNLHVHEKLRVNGRTVRLKNDMLHYPFLNVSQFFDKFDFYTSFEADFLFKKGLKTNRINRLRYCFFLPLTRFLRRYIFKLGFLDGIPGLFACIFDGLKFIVTYMKLNELYKGKEKADIV